MTLWIKVLTAKPETTKCDPCNTHETPASVASICNSISPIAR